MTRQPVRPIRYRSSAASGSDPYQVRGARVNLLIPVVDDEPDVEVLFRQHFRHDLRAGRFTMDFAQSAQSSDRCSMSISRA